MKISKNVLRYLFGRGAFGQLGELLAPLRRSADSRVVFCIDHYFKNRGLIGQLPASDRDEVRFIDTTHEPKTTGINQLADEFRRFPVGEIVAVVGIGGGATMDTAKAISNLLTNDGPAEQYQGWDLVRKPGVHKIGIPTISGTGSESSRTCVMTNPVNGLKLGMNSDHTIFDQLVLDPDLCMTVPRNQYFYTGLDTYIHCIESLSGRNRHMLADAFSHEALRLSRQVFLESDMQEDANREALMTASYLGGCAIANSYVGLVHPFSAGLSVVLGLHHGIGNCIAMLGMEEFYPKEYKEFMAMVDRQQVDIPRGVCKGLSDDKFEALYQSTIIHEKPLANALGDSYRSILTPEKVKQIFLKM
ncbi:MAG TPA: iron-containing alcohol dehydrogenase family protein [Candidatus Ozemobacteraceae bacterium]